MKNTQKNNSPITPEMAQELQKGKIDLTGTKNLNFLNFPRDLSTLHLNPDDLKEIQKEINITQNNLLHSPFKNSKDDSKDKE